MADTGGLSTQPSGAGLSLHKMQEVYFSKFATDNRYQGLFARYHDPIASLGSENIDFNLPAVPEVMFWDKMFIQFGFKIVKEGTDLPPADNAKVGTVDNICHSAISDFQIYLNGQQINTYSRLYGQKAMMRDTLSFASDVKFDRGLLQGLSTDSPGYFGASASNAGWERRRVLFLASSTSTDSGGVVVSTDKYSSQPVYLVGNLCSDFSTLEQGLIYQVPVTVRIQLAKSSYVILKAKSEVQNYELKVTSARLYVGYARLNYDLQRSIETRLSREACQYHFREVIVQQYNNIPNTTSFETPNIAGVKQFPVRLYAVLTLKSSLDGNDKLNPYDWRRMWNKKSGVVLGTDPDPDPPGQNDDDFEAFLLELAAASAAAAAAPVVAGSVAGSSRSSGVGVDPGLLASQLFASFEEQDNIENARIQADIERRARAAANRPTTRAAGGRGRGLGSASAAAAAAPPGQAVENDMASMLRSYHNWRKNRKKVKNSAIIGGEPDPWNPAQEYIWVTDIRCTVNNVIQDVYHGLGTRYACPLDFLRFNLVHGIYGENVATGIDNNTFNTNSFIACWNLSCTPSQDLDSAVPSVPVTDQIRVHVDFSESMPYELSMVTFMQVTKVLTGNKLGIWNTSMSNTAN